MHKSNINLEKIFNYYNESVKTTEKLRHIKMSDLSIILYLP